MARFPVRGGLLNRVTREVHAVEKVSFDLWPGETLSLVGESGCGASRPPAGLLLRLVETQGGTAYLRRSSGSIPLAGGKLQALRRNIQFIFQDPYASLDPRQTVGDSIMEPLRVHGLLRGEAALGRVAWLLKRVGLQPEHAGAIPCAFPAASGSGSACPRAGAGSEGGDSRRVGVGPGCLHSGADYQSDARPAARDGHRVSVYFP